ncbi:tyrosine-protein kinase TXK isoform X1 [Gadus chalcogrammus]|uniref:tyrosine-protein kinase TXK isoform X1 n=1 Tax=Gadus chalcogrammus TaxID=1042646 RepID=UPI0024C48D8B|nr:tyrosine-protein kinase TXK isoform X1 [Gadus chalcogrammus]
MIQSNQFIFCCCCVVQSSNHMEMDERRSSTCFQLQIYPGRARREDRSRRRLPPTPPIEEDYEDQGLLRVVATCDLMEKDDTDLRLIKGEEYTILHKQTQHRWRAQDRMGNRGFIPSNYVKEKVSMDANLWCCNITRTEAEHLLRQEDKEGGYVLRTSSHQGLYTVSVYSKTAGFSCIRHYQIKHTDSGQFFLAEKYTFGSIPEVITYHQHNAAGLVTRLRYLISPMRRSLPIAGFSSEKWEIDLSELTILEEVGSGQFGVVRLGMWRGQGKVAIKAVKENTMRDEDFIEEAKVMMRMDHPQLVKLYGVCLKQQPLMLVTEFMDNGCLLNFLRQRGRTVGGAWLLSTCQDICQGMTYLERHNYLHRDLAARNCLVDHQQKVKVSDFGMTRYVLDNQYTSSIGCKFPVKWSPPEVLHFSKYSSKSDVWSFGVVMWEVYSEGRIPFENHSNQEVVENISRGVRLYRPHRATSQIYNTMYRCWHETPLGRPTFSELLEQLNDIEE